MSPDLVRDIGDERPGGENLSRSMVKLTLGDSEVTGVRTTHARCSEPRGKAGADGWARDRVGTQGPSRRQAERGLTDFRLRHDTDVLFLSRDEGGLTRGEGDERTWKGRSVTGRNDRRVELGGHTRHPRHQT